MRFRLTGAASAILPAAAFVLSACGQPDAPRPPVEPEPPPIPGPDRIDPPVVEAPPEVWVEEKKR